MIQTTVSEGRELPPGDLPAVPEARGKATTGCEQQQELIRQAIREIVASDEFRRSSRMIRFLEYIVWQSCCDAPRLTERMIGIAVFDREADWDPKVDPIVRIEARRLREKLRRYYETHLEQGEVQFDLPKGGYEIVFRFTLSIRPEQPAGPATAGEESQAYRSVNPAFTASVSEPAKSSDTFKLPNFGLQLRPIPARLGSLFSGRVSDIGATVTPVSNRSNRRLWVIAPLIFLVAIATGLLYSCESGYVPKEDHPIRVSSFKVENPAGLGVDGAAVAGMIADQIRALQHATRMTFKAARVEDSWSFSDHLSGAEQLPKAFASLAHAFRFFDGPEEEITGSLDQNDPNLVTLYVRGNDIPAKNFVGHKSNLPELFNAAAEYLYGACQPSAYSVFLIEHQRGADAVAFAAAQYPKAHALGDRNQLLYSWATGLDQQGDIKGAIEKFKLAIDLAPESWGSYIALQDEYEELGETSKAISIGHQLERRAHRGSWLFKHLPPVIFRPPSATTFMVVDELTSNYIGLKQSMEADSMRADGGTELVPFYPYYAQVLSNLHDRPAARLELELAQRQPDRARIEGEILVASAEIALEEQDFTTLRSVLSGYRSMLLDQQTRGSLLMDNQDGICELMVMYERIGDSVVSNLLSEVGHNTAECISRRAEVQQLRGSAAQAETLYLNSVETASELPSSHYSYGLFLLQQGREQDARSQFSLAHESGPHWADPLFQLAGLAYSDKDYRKASELYAQASLLAPSWGLLYIRWGQALLNAGNREEAAKKLALARATDLTIGEEKTISEVFDALGSAGAR